MVLKIICIIPAIVAALLLIIFLWGIFDGITGFNTYYKATGQYKKGE